jgi:hypothetical protein
VPVARERPQPLAQQLSLEIGAWSGHGVGVRRDLERSFRENVSSGLVKKPVYVRIRTNQR